MVTTEGVQGAWAQGNEVQEEEGSGGPMGTAWVSFACIVSPVKAALWSFPVQSGVRAAEPRKTLLSTATSSSQEWR